MLAVLTVAQVASRDVNPAASFSRWVVAPVSTIDKLMLVNSDGSWVLEWCLQVLI